MAMTPDGMRVFVANGDDNVSPGTVSVINTDTNTVIATTDVGDPPFGIAICQFIPPPPPLAMVPTLSE